MQRTFCEQTHSPHLDLQSIEASLRGVQREFPLINQELNFSRERMDDEVVENLISGYGLINQLLEANIELFALGSSSYLFELNTRVLCGTSEMKRREYHKHIAANNRYFYERTDAGIQDLYEWYTLQRNESVWHRAAGVYIRILSEPQVFIEGNDRTGALVMSYILAKEGQPPFVLTAANAKAYFESSARIKKLPRNGLVNLFRLPLLKAQIAGFLKDQAQTGCLP
jgi:prophage maintenance system killer protein